MKRLFTVASLMAMLNLAALVGLGAFAWSEGWLDRDRVRKAIHVLKGEEEESHSPTTMPAETHVAREGHPTPERLRISGEQREKESIELSRRESEIRNGWQLLETQQLALLQQKERQEEEQERYEAERKKLAEKDQDGGLQKEISIISGLAPKTAKDILKLKNEADAVHILASIEVRVARKIVSQCKTEDERLWIKRLLEKLHDSSAAQAEALSAGT